MTIETEENDFHLKLRWFHETKLAAEWLGFDIVDTTGTSGHEGFGCHLLETHTARGVQYAILPWFYGSCGTCDEYHQVVFDRKSADDCFELFGDLVILFDDEQSARDAYLHRPSVSGYCGHISFSTFAFPILRRVYPALIANEIVSVQPMTASAGALFHMDYVYDTQPKFVSGKKTVQTISLKRVCRDLGEVTTHEHCTDDVCQVSEMITLLRNELKS